MAENTRTTSYGNPATDALKKIKEKQLKQKEALVVAAGDNLAELMKLGMFREVVNGWLKACGVDDTINHKNSNDREQALGKREIGLLIKKELETASSDLYDLMVDEARDKKRMGETKNA